MIDIDCDRYAKRLLLKSKRSLSLTPPQTQRPLTRSSLSFSTPCVKDGSKSCSSTSIASKRRLPPSTVAYDSLMHLAPAAGPDSPLLIDEDSRLMASGLTHRYNQTNLDIE